MRPRYSVKRLKQHVAATAIALIAPTAPPNCQMRANRRDEDHCAKCLSSSPITWKAYAVSSGQAEILNQVSWSSAAGVPGQSRRLPINRLLTSRFRTCRDAAIAHFSQENGDELHTSSARDRPDSIHFDYRGSHCGFFDIDHSFTGFVLRLKLDATERALPRRRVTDLRILSRRTGGQFGLSAFIAIFEWKLKPITERRRQPGQ